MRAILSRPLDVGSIWLNNSQTFYISIVLYNASLTAIKTTFLLQYFRILGTGVMRTIIIVAFFLIGLWSVSQLLVVVFTCSPIPKFWAPDMEGKCIPNLPFWYINAAGNIVTDVAVFLLPLPALSRLNLRRGQKLGLLGVFSLGFFVGAPLFAQRGVSSGRSLTIFSSPFSRPVPSPSSASNTSSSAPM